jgi:hypothetical protein
MSIRAPFGQRSGSATISAVSGSKTPSFTALISPFPLHAFALSSVKQLGEVLAEWTSNTRMPAARQILRSQRYWALPLNAVIGSTSDALRAGK